MKLRNEISSGLIGIGLVAVIFGIMFFAMSLSVDYDSFRAMHFIGAILGLGGLVMCYSGIALGNDDEKEVKKV